jgi:hypothetical protein
MATAEAALVEIDLGTNGGKFRLRTVEEIGVWARKELEDASWIAQVSPNEQLIRNFRDQYLQPLRDISTFAHQAAVAEQNKNAGDLANQIRAFKSRAEEFFRPKPRHSSLPRSKFIIQIRDTKGPTTALYALGFLEGSQMVPQNAESYAGLFEGFLFQSGLLESGIAARTETAAKALEELRVAWKGRNDEAIEALGSLRKQFDERIEDARTQLIEQRENHDVKVQRNDATFSEALSRGQQKLDDIAATYNAHMALEAPVTYWKSQQGRHKWLAIGFAAASAVWMFGALFGLYFVADMLMSSKETITIGGLPLPKVPLWHVAIAAVLLTLYFWVTRILIRILVSQIHLHTDASERVVMVMTYLALLRDGKGPKDEDRQLVLQTLFRPATSGMVDDAIPPTVLEWLAARR